jgi:hypothetical protein
MRYNGGHLTMEEVQYTVVYTADGRPKLVNVVPEVVRLRSTEFVTHFLKPLQADP